MKKAKQLDQFYTSAAVAKECVAFLDRKVGVFTSYCEPSAGQGAFLTALDGRNWEAFDLDPKFRGVEKKDFFSAECTAPCIVGNPPFGKNSCLAVKFFNHAASFATTQYICMILPKTFRKTSIQNRLNLEFHLIQDEDIKKNAFIFEEEEYDVPCCFQIWERKETLRVIHKPTTTSPWFTFVTAKDADFAVRRVGALAGKILTDFGGYSPSSHYYIKCKNKKVKNVFYRLDFSNVICNTAGCPSLSKAEVCESVAREMNHAKA